MKTRHFFYLILTLLLLVSSIFALDYRSKYLEINSQYETVKSQLDKEVKYQQKLQLYSQEVYKSYDKMIKNYSLASKELDTLKTAPKEKVIVYKYRSVSSVSKKDEQISKLTELIESNKSQIESLNSKMNEVGFKCSQPIVKIVDREVRVRVPASVSQDKTKKIKNNPTDKFH